MGRWDPWRGCHRCSEGCKFCYIHKGDAKRGIDTNTIVRNDNFYRLTAKKKNGENVSFHFRQCGTHFIKDGKQYTLQVKDLCSQARCAGIDYERKNEL